MPSPTTSDYPRPKSWEEFENIVADIYREVWKDPYLKRYGRQGQKQYGIDILGNPRHLDGAFAAIQCKAVSGLKFSALESDVQAAEGFDPVLTEFVVATTATRDTVLQSEVAKHKCGFRLEIVFWEDLCLHLSGFPLLLAKHFPGWVKSANTYDACLEMLQSSGPMDFDYDDSIGVYLYKLDTDLRLHDDRSDDSFKRFSEVWVRKFPDPDATVYKLQVFYRESPIKQIFFANLDGGRCLMPFPKSADDLRISSFQYAVAKIVNGQFQGSDLDHYMKVAGIIVDENLA